MAACANCARELRPEWKFCVSCGMPTGVTAARPETKAIPIVSMPVEAPVGAVRLASPVVAAPVATLVAEPPEEPAMPTALAGPIPVSAPTAIGESDHDPGPAVGAAPTLLVAPPEPEPPAAPLSVRTRSTRTRPRRRVNALAIVALVLGCLASPLAALFGHLALAQITVSRERGRMPAIIAIVLGYGSLAFIVGVGLLYLTSRG